VVFSTAPSVARTAFGQKIKKKKNFCIFFRNAHYSLKETFFTKVDVILKIKKQKKNDSK
jgi:hypothetical protein